MSKPSFSCATMLSMHCIDLTWEKTSLTYNRIPFSWKPSFKWCIMMSERSGSLLKLVFRETLPKITFLIHSINSSLIFWYLSGLILSSILSMSNIVLIFTVFLNACMSWDDSFLNLASTCFRCEDLFSCLYSIVSYPL